MRRQKVEWGLRILEGKLGHDFDKAIEDVVNDGKRAKDVGI